MAAPGRGLFFGRGQGRSLRTLGGESGQGRVSRARPRVLSWGGAGEGSDGFRPLEAASAPGSAAWFGGGPRRSQGLGERRAGTSSRLPRWGGGKVPVNQRSDTPTAEARARSRSCYWRQPSDLSLRLAWRGEKASPCFSPLLQHPQDSSPFPPAVASPPPTPSVSRAPFCLFRESFHPLVPPFYPLPP